MMSTNRLASLPLADKPLKLSDGLIDSISQMHERWNNRLEAENADIAEAYIQGRIGLLIHFQRRFRDPEFFTRWGSDDRRVLESHARGGSGVRANNPGGGEDGQNHVLIFHVQVVKSPNKVSLPVFEKFEGLEKIGQIASGCFYSLNNGFVITPFVTDGQFSVSVLCAAVQPSKFPVRVIEGGSQIVNCIRKNKGKDCWRQLANVDGDDTFPGFIAMASSKGVRVTLGPTSESLYEITDMMLGPFDL